MPEYIQQAADLSRVAGDADPGRVVIREDVIQNLLAARQLVVRGLPLGAAPELIALREALLEGEVGNGRMDVRLARAAIACMDADAFAKELLDDRLERSVMGRLNTAESQLSRGSASGQG